MDAKSVKLYIDLHKGLKIPFEVTLSNYTTRIKSELYDLHFMKNAQSNKVFVAYSKVKDDVLKKQVPDVNMQFLKYYQTNFKYLELYADKIYNVDIKSAYANILFNDGYISDSTFNYVASLEKTERLAAVGMLAGRKNVFQFNESGKIEGRVEVVSPTSNYFFYAVKRTYEIIDRCKMEIGNDFLFSWVDGIYFIGKENGAVLQELLTSEFNLKSSFEELTEFEIERQKDHYLLTYLKEGKPKVFNIPLEDSAVKMELYNYLLNLNKTA